MSWSEDLNRLLDGIFLQLDAIAFSTVPQHEAPSLRFGLGAVVMQELAESKREFVATSKINMS